MTSAYVYSKSSAIPIPVATTQDNAPLSLKDVAFFLRMRWRWIILTMLGFVALGTAYAFLAKPTFVAEAQLIVQPQVSGSDPQRSSAEDAFIEAQIEIANSSDVLGAAASALNLVADPEFDGDALSIQDLIRQELMSLFSGGATDRAAETPALTGRSEDQKKLDRVIARLRGAVTFRRIGRSMILEISASALSSEKAAAIANSVAQEYIRKNIAMNASTAQQYSTWLEGFVAQQQRDLADAAGMLTTYKNNPKEQSRLAELQSAADARSALFQTTLTRLTETKQRISYPVSDANFVSQATPPLTKAYPRSGLIVGFAGAIGIIAGLMLAMIRHSSDRRITNSHRLSQAITLPFVLLLGKSKRTRRNRSTPFFASQGMRHSIHGFPTMTGMGELGSIVAGFRRRQRSVIGIVAVDGNSGATTVASEIAILSALSGSRTLLVDAAAQSGSLSKWITPQSETGLVDVIEDATRLSTVSLDITPTLKFLPLGKPSNVSPAVRFSSRRTQLSIEELKKKFDTVIFDLTDFSSCPDASAIGPELDGVLVVTCYGRTSIDEASRAVETMRSSGTEILGAIINKTPARWMP